MIQVRTGLFETNSSSVHSLILCDANDYDDWINGDKLLNVYYDYNWTYEYWEEENYEDTTVIKKTPPPQFVTLEEAAYYDKYYPYPQMEEDEWGYHSIDFMDENGEYHSRKFLTFEEYDKVYGYDFETFEESYITPKGEKVVAFGYFGRDG